MSKPAKPLVLTTALAALALSGCSQPSEQQAESTPALVPAATTSQWEQVGPIPVWEPTVEIIAPTFTEEQALALRDQSLRERIEFWSTIPESSPTNFDDFDPADYPPEGWYDLATYYQKTVECLQEQGFSAVIKEGVPVFDPGVPVAQSDALNLASAICDLRFPLEPKILANKTFTADQLSLRYDYLTQFYLPCLEAFGMDWRSKAATDRTIGELPTRETYIDSNGDWAEPWLINFMPEGERLNEIAKICPRDPPTEDLYG